jgi:methanogenic corrinoid protein MtbC1
MDGLTQDGLTYCGLMQGSANGAWWPQEAQHEQLAGLTDLAERHEASEIEERRLSLAQTIEAEIIPRLMLLHQERAPIEARTALDVIAPEEIAKFCALVMDRPLAEALERVVQLQSDAVPIETIYMQLFAPTARLLGEMWEADVCSFADVTIGLSRLQQLMQTLSASFCEERVTIGRSPRALMLPSPGEQHTLGLYMVSEFFRREGWDVWGNSFHAGADVATLVKAEWFDVVGFSLASEVKLDALQPCIDAVRRASQNPAIKILLGGPLVTARPELVEQVGADAMASDAQHAVKVATELVAAERWR